MKEWENWNARVKKLGEDFKALSKRLGELEEYELYFKGEKDSDDVEAEV